MRRFLWLLLCASLWGQTTLFPKTTVLPGTTVIGSSGAATFTLVHHTPNNACSHSSATCTTTVPSTTAGNLLVVTVAVQNNSGGLSWASGSGGGSWTQCPSVFTNILNVAANRFYSEDCAYVLSATGGVTSISFTLSGTPSNDDYSADIFEVSRTSGSWTIDTSGNSTDTTCTTCAGKALTLGGSNDFIMQLAMSGGLSAISGGYSSDIVNTGFGNIGLFGWLINSTTGTAPNFTQSPTDTLPVGAIAFK